MKNNSIKEIITESYKQATIISGKPACWVEADGRLIWVNSILKNMLDLESEQEAVNIFEINPSVNLLSWKKYWSRLEKKRFLKSNTTLITKKENIFSTVSTGFYVEHEGDCWCCLVYDTPDPPKIPQNGQLKNLIQNSSDRMMKHTLDHAREMIFWVNRAGDIIYVNNRVAQKTGYDKNQLMELKAWDFSTYIQTPEDWDNFFKEVKSQKELSIKTELLKKDGGVNYIDAVSTYMEYEGNEYIFSIVLDVTKKREREELLHKMKFSFDHARNMFCWFNKDGKVIYVNEKGCIEIGYSQEEFQNMYLWDFVPNVSQSRWPEIWDRFKSNKFVEPYETAQKRKDGTIYPSEVSGTHLEYNGQEYLFVMSANITERKSRQAKLDKAMRELNDLKTQLENERNYLEQEIQTHHNFNEIVTKNKRYRKTLQQIQQVAPIDTTVLVLGETGTGKELIARAIHNLSNRRDRAMIKINCASLPASLIESELFGHDKGAFTGAFKQKTGRFELADNGTIFLDEIGEMPLDLQAKILRVLQEGEFERLGGTKTIKVDVRVIAATNRDLVNMIDQEKFREDLYYRLNVFPIYNIPLRERSDDVPLLVNFFINKFAKKQGRKPPKVSKASLERLMHYNFPGNIRELENLIERAIILSPTHRLNLDAVLPSLSNKDKMLNKRSKEFLTIDEMQRLHILEALERTHWKVTGQNSASELLGMNGKTLASRMKKLNISR